MPKYELTIAPTTHVIKWHCPDCGLPHGVTVEGGDRLPKELNCPCGFEIFIREGCWTYNLPYPLDDLKEITVDNIPVHK